MSELTVSDWATVYAVILSTIIAASQFVGWTKSGPKLSVFAFSPSETSYRPNIHILAVIANTGDRPIVVSEVEFSFRDGKARNSNELHKATFNDSTRWKPSTKIVPVEGKPNTSTEIPNILQVGDEIRGPVNPPEIYDESQHWVKVTAKIRGKEGAFSGWAVPKTNDVSKEIVS